MRIAKRVLLFLAINFLVVITISTILNIFNVTPFLSSYGLDTNALMLFCLAWGMGGAFISLFLSKSMSKWMMGVEIIDENSTNQDERELLNYIKELAEDAGLKKAPSFGIYHSNEVNAFATGATRNSALIAVSSGLLNRMRGEEIKAVLGHEMAHIANGDMVTMTLLQGIVNAFVMFLARVLGFLLSGIGRNRNNSSYFSYYMFVYLFEFAFMILGSIPLAAFSRFREFRADKGSSDLVGKEKMIDALKALKASQEIKDPLVEQRAFQSLKISSRPKRGFLYLFASHPTLDERIERLQNE